MAEGFQAPVPERHTARRKVRARAFQPVAELLAINRAEGLVIPGRIHTPWKSRKVASSPALLADNGCEYRSTCSISSAMTPRTRNVVLGAAAKKSGSRRAKQVTATSELRIASHMAEDHFARTAPADGEEIGDAAADDQPCRPMLMTEKAVRINSAPGKRRSRYWQATSWQPCRCPANTRSYPRRRDVRQIRGSWAHRTRTSPSARVVVSGPNTAITRSPCVTRTMPSWIQRPPPSSTASRTRLYRGAGRDCRPPRELERTRRAPEPARSACPVPTDDRRGLRQAEPGPAGIGQRHPPLAG